jgi:hypothetical protein
LKGKRTLHPLLSTISTKQSAPVIGPVRLRRGKAADVRGAETFVAEAIAVARQAGACGSVLVRADSKFSTAEVVAACRRGGAFFSLTTGINPSITTMIGQIPDRDWIDIEYPHPIEDPDTGQPISKAQVAEVASTAFTGRRKHQRVAGRLIVRRVRRENAEATQGQGELFAVYRYHPLFTDNPGAADRGRGVSPPTRDHRTHHRGPEGQCPGPPALGVVSGQQRLADPRRDRPQPDPRCGMRRVGVSRPGRDRHHPRPADRRTGPYRPLRPASDHPPAGSMALRTRLAAVVHYRARPTSIGDLTPDCTLTTSPTPHGASRRTESGGPNTPHRHPQTHHRGTSINLIRNSLTNPGSVDSCSARDGQERVAV